ncbi:MAG: SDR family oxidoreductase [Chloroflexi bacterium]|nr:SDR family oxidoreductase [Chloroflexota bacterium]MCI0781916.1 SDR family oxidoreductase [Chloroflexota bacterium]MCI0787790.1 SDR family oxidoreductase [Chloroflexota bacterium]MCI0794348.1 SDR family oxidoreductase [Chloroflexota bacterium]MCI0800184.1 SDR family oxidoreductase [Chloroflexota bacterium]
MDLGLKDRVAIVGGSSRGIGRSIALAFAHEGASVTISARTEADLRRTEIEMARIGSQHHVLAIPADLSSARDIRRVVRDTLNRFGQIGILVTHVWYETSARPSELHDDTIMAALEQGFLSAVRLAREAIPYMKQQRWGRIINLLPTDVKHPANGSALSASCQAALTTYSKMLANELAPFNITVNNVVAGPIQTDFLSASMETRAQEQRRTTEEVVLDAVGEIPMGRLGLPEEVADLVAFLASDRAGFITGTNVVIDGGRLQNIN